MNAAFTKSIIAIMGMFIITLYARNVIADLHQKNRDLRARVYSLELKQERILTVTATMYEAKRSQTDSTPHITADGTRINTRHAGKYRYIAVSRNLLEGYGGPLKYGDYVIVEGISGKYDGVWQVKDTMHSRWVNRIDLLCNPGTKPFKKQDVVIRIPA